MLTKYASILRLVFKERLLHYLLYNYYTINVFYCLPLKSLLYFYNILAGLLGIEPRITESKSGVIPFHYRPTVYYLLYHYYTFNAI